MQLSGQCAFQTGNIPLFFDAIDWHIQTKQVMQHALTQRTNRFANVRRIQQLVALFINDFTLIVGHIIVFEQLLADIEVALFDLALCRFQRTADQRVLDRLAFRHFQAHHDAVQTVASKNLE